MTKDENTPVGDVMSPVGDVVIESSGKKIEPKTSAQELKKPSLFKVRMQVLSVTRVCCSVNIGTESRRYIYANRIVGGCVMLFFVYNVRERRSGEWWVMRLKERGACG